MSGMGVALMGTGRAKGEGRAMQAAQRAISSPLLEDISVTARAACSSTSPAAPTCRCVEVNEASCVIQEPAHEDANIIFGAVVDPRRGERSRSPSSRPASIRKALAAAGAGYRV